MDSTNQVLKDLEDLLPNRSLAPPAVPPEPGHQNVYSFDSLKQSLFFSQQSVEKTTDVASIVILYFLHELVFNPVIQKFKYRMGL